MSEQKKGAEVTPHPNGIAASEDDGHFPKGTYESIYHDEYVGNFTIRNGRFHFFKTARAAWCARDDDSQRGD